MNELSGTVLREYELQERIGTSVFAVVYRGFEPSIGREIAIKVILPKFANQPDFIQRFEKEAQQIARLEHPHIVPLYNYWRNASETCLVSRLLRGGNLCHLLQKNGVLSVERAALFLDQIAAALYAAHRNGVIHHDLKPENILFDEDGNAYLADVGIAAIIGDDTLAKIRLETAERTPNYVSPEQVRGEPVDHRSDIYALGMILYEVLTGEYPFPNTSQVERLYQQLNDLLPPVYNLEPSIAEAVNAVLQKATAKDPALRYPNAVGFAQAFREATQLNYPQTKEDVVERLTLREQEVLQRIVQRKSNQVIAQELYLAHSTVKWYNKQIFHKLRVRNRTQAIIRARELKLLEHPSNDLSDSGTLISGLLEPENPYKGLLAFQSADNQDFFGRERLIQEVLERMAEANSNRIEIDPNSLLRKTSLTRFIAIVGPSGSGKSSLVKAGLIPALWRGDLLKPEHWFVVEVIPGSHPVDNLDIALAKVAATYSPNLHELLRRDQYGLIRAAQLILPNDGSELVLVIDQFEEVFTLVRDEAVRLQFLNMLVAAVTDTRSRVRIVITLRADFYDRPLCYPEFGEMVRSRMVTILPLTANELERAIIRPAERVGAIFEPGLVASIIAEVNYQPGALPLLQFTLTELFERRSGLSLTREAYESIGGAVGALANQANTIYHELSEAGQDAVRQMFLRLVTLGEGTGDTRRRVPRSELMAITPNKDLMEDLIDTYASYRLLSLDHDPATCAPTVEIAHEALIHDWGMFREWLMESREDLRIHQQLMLSAEQWINANRDPSFLATGGRLTQFESLVEKARIATSEDERIFVNASISERLRRDYEREVQQKRMLSLQRSIIVILAVFLLTAVTLSIFALLSRNDALSQSRIAFSRQLAAQALAELRDPVGNYEYAALLAIRALNEEYDSVADSALVEAAFRLPLRVLIGHSDEVYDAKFSPDGRYVLTGSADQTARLWNAFTGQLIETFRGDGGEVYAVAFSPDGNFILTGNEDHSVRMWELASNQQLRPFNGHDGSVDSVTFSPDGTHILTRSTEDGTARLWDAVSGKQLRIVAHDGSRGVAFSPDGNALLVSDAGNVVTLTETSTDHLLQTFLTNGNPIYAVAFSPDGQFVLTGSMDNTATLWETASGREIYTLRGHSSSVRGVTFSPDGKYILTGSSDHTMRLWDVATGQEVRRFGAHSARIWSVDFSPDGRTILSASADHTVKLWNVATNDELATFSEFQDEVYDVAFSPTGDYVLIASADGTAGIWDVASQQEIRLLLGHTRTTFSVAFSPDGAYALTGNDDATAKLWDTATGREVRTFIGHADGILGVAFSPDGTYVLTGSKDTTARLWNAAIGREVRTFIGHANAVNGVSFSPDGTYTLTVSADGSVKLWETISGQEVRTFTSNAAFYDARFSPDGRFILTGNANGSVILWDVISGNQVRTYAGATNSVYNVAFSLDGNYIAAGSADRTAIIWNSATGVIVRILRGHRAAVWGIAFSPDSRFVLTGSLDHTANLWQTDYRDFVEAVCGRLFRDFTDQERELVPIADHDPTCPQFSQR